MSGILEPTKKPIKIITQARPSQVVPETKSLGPIGLDQIHLRDCIESMRAMPSGTVDLVFADPPFNIGYQYDTYDDRLVASDYLRWSKEWMGAVYDVLKPDGTFWLAIGDEYAAELKVAASELGFTTRNWVIWYYTFGVNCKYKFTRSHAHLFYFVKDHSIFTFDNNEIRVPSARQLVYADARANATGRIPDDTWFLRPQDCVNGLQSDEDLWYFPRVAGTFKERAGFHGCQMPEQLLGRIIRACSRKGELVLDPFSGSGTTLAVAKKLGRRFLGFDLSAEYVAQGTKRLETIRIGDPLDGAADPKQSAPTTANGKQRDGRGRRRDPRAPRSGLMRKDASLFDDGNRAAIVDAFRETYRGFSVDRVIADPILNEDFQHACKRHSVAETAAQCNRQLLAIRRNGELRRILDIDQFEVTTLGRDELEPMLFASEIAWQQLRMLHRLTLDELLCDPRLATQLDQRAQRIAPGYPPLHYRWGALRMRKAIHTAEAHLRIRSAAKVIEGFSEPMGLDGIGSQPLPAKPGVYVVSSPTKTLFVGEACDLQQRMNDQFGTHEQRRAYAIGSQAITVRWRLFPIVANPLAAQRSLVRQLRSFWNVR
jgi:DNA modification methylase